MKLECKNCKLFKGDCGHHPEDEYGHINYEITDVSSLDSYNNCSFYIESRDEQELLIDDLKYLRAQYYSNDSIVNDILNRAIVYIFEHDTKNTKEI